MSSFHRAPTLAGVTLCALLLALASSHRASADLQPEHLARGFEQATKYEFGDVDHINLFNGNLIITLPIGQTYAGNGDLSYGLSLVYNSKLWDYRTQYTEACGLPSSPSEQPVAYAGRDFNAGLGWRLSLGQLFEPLSGTRNPSPFHWLYIGPDGAEHLLYEALHEEEEPSDDGVFFSRDGSYLRLTVDAGGAGEHRLELPDGMRHWFGADGMPTRIEDRYTNSLDISYSNGTGGETYWTLDDGLREHRIVFRSRLYDNLGFVPHLDRVELETFGGATATYRLNYRANPGPVDRPAGHDPQSCTSVPDQAHVPILDSVTLPDSSDWTMEYQLTDPGWLPGTITSLRLPTRGVIEWDHGQYRFPTGQLLDNFPGPPPDFFEVAAGVVERRVIDPRFNPDAVIGRWTYTQTLVENPDPADPPTEIRNLVREYTRTNAVRNQWTHYFSAWNVGSGVRSAQYGLPFSPDRGDGGGRFLSQDVQPKQHDTADGRSLYLQYEWDTLGAFNTYDRMSDRNFRVRSRRTDFWKEGRERIETHSSFDGLGHYRTTTISGDFEHSAARTVTTNYNPSSGTYPGNFTLPSHWVLDTYDSMSVSEGGWTEARQYCFGSTGFLLRERIQTGSSRSSDDVVRVYSRSAAGNRTSEAHYGSDSQTIGTSANLCGLSLPASPWYRIDHSYQAGQLATSRYAFQSYDHVARDVDSSTGLTQTSYDVSGIATDYDYDSMGRLILVDPQSGHGGRISYTHTPATNDAPSGVANTRIVFKKNQSNVALAEARVYFSPMGLLSRQRIQTGDGTWAEQETQYDGSNRLVARSTWTPDGDAKEWTLYDAYDPWDRARSIFLPGYDSETRPTQRVNRTYWGERKMQERFYVGTTSIAAGSVSESQRHRVEEYDLHRRLVRVRQHEGQADGVVAAYGYDAGDRLRNVRLSSSAQVHQDRSFTYDGRGFLLSETHPESGTTTYDDYDPRGHASTVTSGGGARTLKFDFDSAERLTSVREPAAPANRCRTMQEFVYGSSNGPSNWRRGRLETARRFNCGEVPWVADATFQFKVEETYRYGGRDGRASKRTIDSNGGENVFEQTWAYDALGNVSSIGYPRCTAGTCLGSGAPSRTISPTYSNGWLRTVPGFADRITHHPSGMVTKVEHANGVDDVYTPDPWNRPLMRNLEVYLAGDPDPGELGIHHYDGSGNLVLQEIDAPSALEHLGSPAPPSVNGLVYNTYLYDSQQRLKSFEDSGGKSQTYSYDAFGNLTQVVHNGMLRSFPTSTASNQMTLATYDAFGNQTANGSRTYTFDSLDMLRKRQSPDALYDIYLYTADNERLLQVESTTTNPASADRLETWTLRDLDGRALSVFERQVDGSGATWSWTKDYIYRGKKPLAQATSATGDEAQIHLSLDHLGTPRLLTGASGGFFRFMNYYPYGERNLATNPDRSGDEKQQLQFTGHERDFHEDWGDDLDYMHARYCSPHYGRFLSVDPARSARGKVPGSWNRYAYALGNPVKFLDPDGEETRAAIMFEQDAQATLSGDMTAEEFQARNAARGVPAVIALSMFVPGPDDALVAAAATRFASTAVARSVGAARQLASRIKRALSSKKELSRSERRAVRSLRKQAEEHRKKLEAYRSNPEGRDNRDFLKNAPSEEIRERIRETRIRSLEHQIKNFEDQIKDIIGQS